MTPQTTAHSDAQVPGCGAVNKIRTEQAFHCSSTVLGVSSLKIIGESWKAEGGKRGSYILHG